MANWEEISKALSDAGKVAAQGLMTRNEQIQQNYNNYQNQVRAAQLEDYQAKRDREARMEDQQKLIQINAETDQKYKVMDEERKAKYAKYFEDPEMVNYMEQLKMGADAGFPEYADEYETLSNTFSSIHEGLGESELSPGQTKALEKMPPNLKSGIAKTFMQNKQDKDRHDYTRKNMQYLDWLMRQEKGGMDSGSLFSAMNQARNGILENMKYIGEIRRGPEYIQAADAWAKAGGDITKDPTTQLGWNEFLANPKNAVLAKRYEEDWAEIGLLRYLNDQTREQMYRLNPMFDMGRLGAEMEEAYRRSGQPLPAAKKPAFSMEPPGPPAGMPLIEPEKKSEGPFFGKLVRGDFKGDQPIGATVNQVVRNTVLSTLGAKEMIEVGKKAVSMGVPKGAHVSQISIKKDFKYVKKYSATAVKNMEEGEKRYFYDMDRNTFIVMQKDGRAPDGYTIAVLFDNLDMENEEE